MQIPHDAQVYFEGSYYKLSKDETKGFYFNADDWFPSSKPVAEIKLAIEASGSKSPDSEVTAAVIQQEGELEQLKRFAETLTGTRPEKVLAVLGKSARPMTVVEIGYVTGLTRSETRNMIVGACREHIAIDGRRYCSVTGRAANTYVSNTQGAAVSIRFRPRPAAGRPTQFQRITQAFESSGGTMTAREIEAATGILAKSVQATLHRGKDQLFVHAKRRRCNAAKRQTLAWELVS